MLFANELLTPSEEVWLVSPWIGDIPILDNRMGGFDALNPEWKGREIRLTEVILQLMSIGTHVSIVTIGATDVPTNSYFIDRMSALADEAALSKKITITEIPKPRFDTIGLHYKGILTNRGFLAGSMNITNKGIKANDEMIEYDINKERIAQAKIHFVKKYKQGVLD